MSKQRALRLKAWLLTLCMVISLVPTAAFAAEGKALNYVSLGDSMSNGYGLTGYNENTSGYEGYGDGAYPNLFAEWLVENDYADTVNHSRLAMSAMRAEDLHFILEVTKSQAEAAGTYDANVWSSFPAGDKYTYDTFTKAGGRFERDGMPGTAAMANIYQSAVEKADVISLNLGSANFGVFLMENIAAAFDGFGGLIEVNAVQHDWMSMLNGCDDTTKSRLQALVDEIKPVITSRLSSLGDAAEPMMDAILYTVVSYLVNYQGVMDAIMDKNDDAHVILIGLTDAAAGMDLTFSVEGNSVPLNALMSLMVKTINAYVASIPAVKYPTAHFYYAEAANVDSLVETFATAIDGDNVIRERFVETIVGATGDGVIWSMASDMLENMDLGEVDAKLVPVTLAEIEAYEDAVANSKVDFLKDNYIDYIVGDDEDKKEEATNKLLSLAFYLSIESAIVAASTDNALDLNALKSLVTGDIKDTFKPLVDAVEKSTSEDNDDLIYELIIAVVNGITISDIEINGEPFEFTLNLNRADVEALVKNEGTDAVYLKMIAQAINQKFPNISEEVAASAVTDIRNSVIDSEAVCKLAEEWVKGEKHEVKFDGETFQVELDLTWQEIQKLITTPADSNDADDIYRDLLASAINQKFPAIDPDLTAKDIKAFIDGDFSSDAAYKLAEQWMKDKAYDVEFDGQTYQVTPNLTWEEIKALATETGDVDSIYRKLLAAAINEKYPAIDPDLTAKDIKDFIGGDFSSDAAYKLAEQWTIGKSFDVEFDGQTYPVTPNLNWQEIKTLVTGVGDTDSIYRELVADAINQRFPNISPDITAGDISNILDNQKPDALFKLAAEWAGSETYSIPWENGTVDVTFELEYTDIKTIAENADSAAAMDVYYNMVAQVINSVYPSINPDVTGADVKAIYGAGTGVYPDKLFEIAEAAAATDPTYGQYGLSDEDIKAIVAGGEAANAVYYREAAEKLNADYFNGAAYIKDSDVAEIVTAADGVYPDKLYEIVEKQLKQDDNPANDYNVEQLKTMVAGGNKDLMDAAKNDVVGASLTEVRSKASQASGELETAKKSIRNAVDGSGDNTAESVANSAKKKVGSQVTTELSNAGGKLSDAINKAKTSVPGMIKDKLTSNDPAKTDTAQAKLTAAFNKAKETVPNTINSKLTSNDPANTDTAQAKLASALKEAKTSVPGMIKDKLISDDPADTDTAQAQLNDAFAKAEETVAGKDVSGKFDLLRQLFAMDEVAAETVKKDESATLRDLLHLFGRMLIGNGLGAHPSASGHAALLNAMTNAKTAQEELKQNIGYLLGGMAGILVKFGADILGVALDSDTVKQYIGDLSGAVEDLVKVLNEKFKDYETSVETLENAIDTMEAKLDALLAKMEELSVALKGKQDELSRAFEKAAVEGQDASKTAIAELESLVDELATAITETRNNIIAVKNELAAAKQQLAELKAAMVDLKAAIAALDNSMNDMETVFTTVTDGVEALVRAYQKASETVRFAVDEVKKAYDATEGALERAENVATKATNLASDAYDYAYSVLTRIYNAMPEDMANVLFGAAGGVGVVALVLTEEILVKKYAEPRIAELKAELATKVAELEAAIKEKEDQMASLTDDVAKKAEMQAEIDDMKAQIAALQSKTAAEVSKLEKGIADAAKGNLATLKASYKALIEAITSGVRPEIANAMEDFAATGVKATGKVVITSLKSIAAFLNFINDEIVIVKKEVNNVYTDATTDPYFIDENSYYVALGDSAAVGNDTYVRLLAEAKNDQKKSDIPFKNLAVDSQTIGEASAYIKQHAAEIAKADLITVGYGNTTFAKVAMDRAKAALNGESYETYNWSKYVGAEGASFVADTLSNIKKSLNSAGLDEEFASGDTTYKTTLADAATLAIEAYAYSAVEYLAKLPSVIGTIREVNTNPDTVVVIVGMYNPLDKLVLEYEEDGELKATIPVGTYLNDLVTAADVYGVSYAMLSGNTTKAIFVSAPAVETPAVDADNSMGIEPFMVKCADGLIKVNPTEKGQEYVKTQILNALKITDQRTPITGTVEITGDNFYTGVLTAEYTKAATETVDYQWYREVNGAYVAIEGATSSTYTADKADVLTNIKVIVTGTDAYYGTVESAPVAIGKAVPPVTAPVGLTATYGDDLESVTFIDKGWTWVDGDITVIEEVGTPSYPAIYTPYEGGEYDPAYYTATDEIQVTVIVGKQQVEKPMADNAVFTYNGAEQTYKIAASALYTVSGNKQTTAGTHTVTVTLNDPINYEWKDGTTAALTFAFTINPKVVTEPVISLSGTSFNYTGDEIKPTVKVMDGETEIPADEYTVTYSDNVNVGTATVTITDNTNGNYTISGSIDFAIIPADMKLTAPEANDLTYTGNAQDLVTAGSVENGTIMYALGDVNGATEEYSTEIPTGTAAGTYRVWYYVKGINANYADTKPARIDVMIKKADSAAQAPVAKDLTYNGYLQQLITVGTADGGTMMYALGDANGATGEYSTSIPTAKPAGTYYVWYYVDGDDNHDDTAADYVEVTIKKLKLAKPAAGVNQFEYDGNAKTYTVAESNWYSFINGSNKATTVGKYTATLALKDTVNCAWEDDSTAPLTYTFEIVKGTPTPDNTPDKVESTYGEDVPQLPDGWSWKDNIKPGKDLPAGEHFFEIIYTPEDENYNILIITIKVIIHKAQPDYVAPAENGRTFDGTEQPLITNVKPVSGGKMQYAVTAGPNVKPTDGEWMDNIPAATNAGIYYVWYRIIGDGNHVNVTEICIVVEIGKKAATITTTPTEKATGYTGGSQYLINPGEMDGGKIWYAVTTDPNTQPADGEWSDNIPTASNAGTYYVWYKIVCDSNHKYTGDQVIFKLEVIVDGAPLIVTTESVRVTYGEPIPEIVPVFDGFVGEDADKLEAAFTKALTYAYKLAGAELPNISPYMLRSAARTTVPTAVGTYQITPSGLPEELTSNYAITYQPGTLEIVEREVGITWGETEFTYNGTAQAPTATATNVVNGDVVELTVSGAETTAGTYTATVTDISNSNYKLPAEVTKEFTIAAKKVQANVVLNSVNFPYTGEAIEPEVTVKDGDTVIDPSEYTVTYSNNTEVGTATVTITDKEGGNYVVSGWTTFTIYDASVPPAQVTKAPEAMTGLVYNGQPQALVTAGTATGDGMLYAVTTVKGEVPAQYTSAIPTATDAGTYFVWYMAVGNEEFDDSLPMGPVTVTIDKADSAVMAIPVANNNLTYTGEALELLELEGTATGGTMMYAVTEVKGTYTDWSETSPTATAVGTYWVWYYVKGDSNHEDTEPKFITVTIAEATAATGTISGTVTSFLADKYAEDVVTVELWAEGATVATYTTTTEAGNSATYTLTDVAAGTYIMKVSKKNHATREYEVTVTADGTVTQDARICPIGDANCDGKVNLRDWNAVKAHNNETAPLTGYGKVCADTDGSGTVNIRDWNALKEHNNETKPLW